MGVGVRGRWARLSLCQNMEKLLEGGWHPLLNANVILICSTWPAHIPCLQGRAPGPPCASPLSGRRADGRRFPSRSCTFYFCNHPSFQNDEQTAWLRACDEGVTGRGVTRVDAVTSHSTRCGYAFEKVTAAMRCRLQIGKDAGFVRRMDRPGPLPLKGPAAPAQLSMARGPRPGPVSPPQDTWERPLQLDSPTASSHRLSPSPSPHGQSRLPVSPCRTSVSPSATLLPPHPLRGALPSQRPPHPG